MTVSFLDFLGVPLTRGAEKIYVKPNIPFDKAKNALDSYASYLTYEDIIVLVDDTVFGSCKEGMIFTNKEIIAKASFSSPIYRKVSELKSLVFKKGIISQTIIIDGEKHSLTQANANDISYLVDKFNEYITNASSSCEASSSKSDFSETKQIVENISKGTETSEVDSLKQQIAELQEQLLSKSETERKTSESTFNKEMQDIPSSLALEQSQTSDPVEEISHANGKFRDGDKLLLSGQAYSSMFNPVPGALDYLFEISKKRTEISFSNVGVSFLNSFLKNALDDMGDITDIISYFFAENIIEIRNNHIDRYNVIGLKNNLSSVESLIYSATMLKFELLERGANERFVKTAFRNSLDDFFYVSKYPKNNNLVIGIYNVIFSDIPLELVPYVYAIRLYAGNINSKIPRVDFEAILSEPLIEQKINYYIEDGILSDCNYQEEAMVKIIATLGNEVFCEIGNITHNYELNKSIRNTGNRIFQYAKEKNLI